MLLVHCSMSNAPSYNVYRNQGKFEHCKLLLELFRLTAINCGQKLFNPPSCAARLQQMTTTCGRITNYTSCVAREPLWRTNTVHNQNTTQASHGTRPFVVLLSSDEQSGVDEASKFCQSIPHSSKSGSRSVLSYMPSRFSRVTNSISNTVNYYTEILRLVSIWSQKIADRGSQIAGDRKESCFHIQSNLDYPDEYRSTRLRANSPRNKLAYNLSTRLRRRVHFLT